MQMHRVDFNNWFYRLTTIINLVTFVIFRGYALGKITYNMFIEGTRISVVYFYTLSGSMFVMNVINPILFWRLFKNDVLRVSFSKKVNAGKINNNVSQLKSN